MALNDQMSLADAIVGQATAGPSIEGSRRRSQGLMAKAKQETYSIEQVQKKIDQYTPELMSFYKDEIRSNRSSFLPKESQYDVAELDYSDLEDSYGEDARATRPEPPTELIDLVTAQEASGYDVIYNGSKVQPPKPITSMSVDEVRAFQIQMKDAGSASTAVGKNQIIQSTLNELVSKGVLSGAETFDEAAQRKAFNYLIKKRGYESFQTVMNSNAPVETKRSAAQKFQLKLAKEFASIPVPYDIPSRKLKKGDSYYKGLAGNQAKFGADEFLDLLMLQE